MSKNLLSEYENGMEDELMNDILDRDSKMKNPKMGSTRVDMKRTRTSYISRGKKAAKKSSVDTSEIENLNSAICGKKHRR